MDKSLGRESTKAPKRFGTWKFHQLLLIYLLEIRINKMNERQTKMSFFWNLDIPLYPNGRDDGKGKEKSFVKDLHWNLD